MRSELRVAPHFEVEFVPAVRPSDEEIVRRERQRAEDELPATRAWREAEAAHERGDVRQLRLLVEAEQRDRFFANLADHLVQRRAPRRLIRPLGLRRTSRRSNRPRTRRTSRRGPRRSDDDPDPPLGADHNGRAIGASVSSRELAAEVRS